MDFKLRRAIATNRSITAAQRNWKALLSIYETKHATFNEACFANLMTQLKRLDRILMAAAKQDKDARYRQLLMHLSKVVRGAEARQIANIAHALGKLNEPGEPERDAPTLMAAIEARSEWLVAEGTPQAIASTLWAFAKLERIAPKLMAAIEARSEWLVAEGKTQEIANTILSFAKLESNAPKLMVAIEARSDWLVAEGNAQTIANTAWAFAKLERDAPRLLDVLFSGPVRRRCRSPA